jgi:16S rRNA (cytidine1402-2'-O)-methyltransferase
MLYLVATPIGNLEDLSSRAMRILREVDFILAEDTRQTQKILSRFDIHTKLVSFHEHASDEKIEWVISELKQGRNVALVSDAGTPNLSDPGGKLVESAMQAGTVISPIPGPSALTSLIAVAPFSCSQFLFLGYFPKKKGRQTMLETIRSSEYPVFFYESPHRITKTLHFLADGLEGFNILIGRELTKKFEEISFFDLKEKSEIDKIKSKGEFVFSLVRKK